MNRWQTSTEPREGLTTAIEARVSNEVIKRLKDASGDAEIQSMLAGSLATSEVSEERVLAGLAALAAFLAGDGPSAQEARRIGERINAQ